MGFTFNAAAYDAYIYGIENKIIDESIRWIIDTVLDQQIVSFSTENGTISFDTDDLVFVE